MNKIEPILYKVTCHSCRATAEGAFLVGDFNSLPHGWWYKKGAHIDRDHNDEPDVIACSVECAGKLL